MLLDGLESALARGPRSAGAIAAVVVVVRGRSARWDGCARDAL